MTSKMKTITQLIRHMYTTPTRAKEVPKNLKTKSHSSQLWLTRQLADPYVEKAKIMNYRCRSAFKLLEMNEKLRIFTPGQCVIDCGAAPGSWCQVAAVKTNADGATEKKQKGLVIGIDKSHIHPIPGAILLGNTDFTRAENQQRIRELLNNRAVDVMLSDMAPNATGVKALDQELIVELARSVLNFARQVCKVKSSILIKVWDSAFSREFENELRQVYAIVKPIKPPACRTNSTEKYLFGRTMK